MEEARGATAADLDALADMWDHSISELDGQRGGFLLAGGLVRPDVPSFLRDSLDDPDRLLVIGTIDDFPVGFASIRCDRSRREPLAVVDLLFVEPDARQVGVGEAIVDRVREWSAGRGCVGIDAPALPGNRSAKAFFEQQGFLARLLVMHFPFPPPDG